MDNFTRSLKLITIPILRNICLKFKDCPDNCPLKCGFSGQKIRCFFDCGIDDDIAMYFSKNVFYDKGKDPPEFLLKLIEYTCNSEDDCEHCTWLRGYCTLFDKLRDLIK